MSERHAERVQQGEIFGYSDITDSWYRVTEWVGLGEGKIQARSKERVDSDDVPQEWLDRVDEVGR